MRTVWLGLTLGCTLLGFSSEATAQSVEVTASALNVRTGPSTRNGRIGLVRRGQDYPVLQRSGSWVKIQYGQRSGWAHRNYLRDTSTPVSTTTAGSLNVRSGPSTRYRILGAVSRGTRVSVESSSGSWKKIAFEGRTAWVHGGYLRNGGSTSPQPQPQPQPGTRPTSAAGYIQLPAAGTGFYGYYGASRRWGTPQFVYGIERVARRWVRERPGAPRIGVGDISLENGGRISGHASHRVGVDGDFRPIRNDGREDRVTIHQSAYSRTLTKHVLDLFEAELPVTHIFFNDTRARTRHTQSWPNHDNHFHVRIRR